MDGSHSKALTGPLQDGTRERSIKHPRDPLQDDTGEDEDTGGACANVHTNPLPGRLCQCAYESPARSLVRCQLAMHRNYKNNRYKSPASRLLSCHTSIFNLNSHTWIMPKHVLSNSKQHKAQVRVRHRTLTSAANSVLISSRARSTWRRATSKRLDLALSTARKNAPVGVCKEQSHMYTWPCVSPKICQSVANKV
eukprot:1162062-Pelagomonas_calceolata.AAC.15